jgi:predicted nucleic acid-binding protein
MTRRPFFDINVLVDVLAKREPHFPASQALWALAESGDIEASISANSITTIYYLMRKHSDHPTRLVGLRLIRNIFRIVPLDAKLIERALESSLADFEDAVQMESAMEAGASVFVTRNLRDFRGAPLPCLSPESFIALTRL